MIYIDTSVLTAYYCPEALSARAQQALQEADGRAISWLVEVEFASVLALKARAHELRLGDARRILALFQSHLQEGIYTRLPISSPHFVQAREWFAALTVPMQTLDALHAAVCAIQVCSMLTSDAGLAKACAQIGVTAQLVR